MKVKNQDQELSTVEKDVKVLFSELSQTKTLLHGISKYLTEMINKSQ